MIQFDRAHLEMAGSGVLDAARWRLFDGVLPVAGEELAVGDDWRLIGPMVRSELSKASAPPSVIRLTTGCFPLFEETA